MEKLREVLNGAEFEVIEKGDVKVLKAKDNKLFVEAVKAVNPSITEKTLKEISKIEEEYLLNGLEVAKEKAIDQFKNSEAPRVEVVLPFGTNKSDLVTYDVVREKEFRIPGKDQTIRKSVVSVEVKKQGCKISKSRIKALEEDISEALGIKR